MVTPLPLRTCTASSMRGGAGIAEGREIRRIRMINIHPTVMALLGLEPDDPVNAKVARGVLTKG